MKALRSLDRRLAFSLGAVGILLGVLAPAVVPALASAAELTSRSIDLSSAAEHATSVTYDVTFTPQSTTTNPTYMVLWFCNNSPLAGQTCNAPSGMSLSTATVGSPGTLDTTSGTQGANFITLSATLTPTDSITIPISSVTNPDGTDLTDGSFYGRIETFDSKADAEAAATGGATTTTGLEDNGGVALAISNQIGINAAVRETMTFCVYGAGAVDTAPAGNCSDTAAATANSDSGYVPPSLTLGQGSPQALSTSAVSTGKDYAQISTNAAHGAVVYMQNSNSCGGLKLFGSSSCAIAPADGTTTGSGGSAGDFTAGLALFGVKLGTPASDGAADAAGTISSNADYTDYDMKTSGTQTDSSGTSLPENVTSTYGGYLFGTSEAPIADQNIPLTFGASVSNTTPAGQYSANIDLVAVGTY